VINTESGIELNIDINSIRYYDENKQLRNAEYIDYISLN